jgi:hypothetical protein
MGYRVSVTSALIITITPISFLVLSIAASQLILYTPSEGVFHCGRTISCLLTTDDNATTYDLCFPPPLHTSDKKDLASPSFQIYFLWLEADYCMPSKGKLSPHHAHSNKP